MASTFLNKGPATNEPQPSTANAGIASTSVFKENTSQERLHGAHSEKEGDEFTVEALVSLDSVDAAASVRTIAFALEQREGQRRSLRLEHRVTAKNRDSSPATSSSNSWARMKIANRLRTSGFRPRLELGVT